MNSSKLGVAVIGTGYWGKKLVGEYLALSKERNDTELRYVVDIDKDRLASIAHDFDLPRKMLETDSSKIFKDKSVQAIHIAIPNHLHFAFGMEALENGKHVLLEKPMALTLRDALKLARKAEEESVVLCVGHIFRFNNAVREARMLLSQDVVGKPLYYHLDWEALLRPPEGRDIVLDLGPHPVDVINFLSNEWPTQILTLGKSFQRRKPNREEVAETVAEFEDDVFAHVSLSWLYAGPRKRNISVTGDLGTIEVDALNQQVMIYDRQGSRNHSVRANNTIQTMITHFVDSILKREPPQVSALVGAMTVAVLSAMRESMRARRFVGVLGD
jgi:predicted dehydrogenase